MNNEFREKCADEMSLSHYKYIASTVRLWKIDGKNVYS